MGPKNCSLLVETNWLSQNHRRSFHIFEKGPDRVADPFSWEVLNGVGVDGVGVIFPFFTHFSFFKQFFAFFFAFLRFSSLSLLLLKDIGKQQQNLLQNKGNFTPTPSAPTPCKTSRFRNVPCRCFNKRKKRKGQIGKSPKKMGNLDTGPNFIHPHPPTPENTPRGGGCIKGGCV